MLREHFVLSPKQSGKVLLLLLPKYEEDLQKCESFLYIKNRKDGDAYVGIKRLMGRLKGIGHIELPDRSPQENYVADTRKGVAVRYIPKALPA